MNREDLDFDYLKHVAHLLVNEYLRANKLEKGKISVNTKITFTFDLDLWDWNTVIQHMELEDNGPDIVEKT